MKNPITQIGKWLATRSEPARSPHWSTTRAAHLNHEPACQWCSGVTSVEVHHIKPFHIHPELELADANLITMCEAIGRQCHLRMAHRGNWKDFDPNIRARCTARHREKSGAPAGGK